MTCRVGIDIGGTFTDFALLDEATGNLTVYKQLTTPDDPARSVIDGLPALLKKGGATMADVATLVHGTTLVTNAIIERHGAVTGMLVTKGFSDVLDIALERRYDMYDMRISYPEPLVPRQLRVEIDERMGADGTVRQTLDEKEVRAAVDRLVAQGVEAIAVCYLNAQANAAHEEATGALIRKAYPKLFVSTSADVFPFIREYERWTTTTMNAFAQPMFDRYLQRLEDGLKAAGFTGALFVMTSSGGTVTVETARRYPVRMLESGPAAGVLLSAALGGIMARPDLLAFDMGGTTAKGALIRNGVPLKRYEMEVARVHEFKFGSGLPAKIPVIDLIEIGAGGGSLAHIDTRGVIAAGPRSAGAMPGPVCYGRGGENPALTDANLLLGYLDARFFLGGEMSLDTDGAARALERVLGKPLGVDAARAAWGVHETVNENVSRAFRNHASERGFDYRTCAMIAFGGSGPLHATRVARKLRVPRVVFPMGAGVMSAIGLLASPLSFETIRSHRVMLDELSPTEFDARFEELAQQAAAHLTPTGLTRADLTIRRTLDMRYRGQGYDMPVNLPDGAGKALGPKLNELFAATYATVFSKSFPAEAVEVVNWKLEVIGPLPGRGADYRVAAKGGATAIKDHRPVWFPEADGHRDTPIYDRYALRPGDTFTGPAVVEENESTVVIGIGDRCEIDSRGHLIVDVALGS